MANRDESGGVGALVRHTAGMAELAIHAGHPDRKHNEYLSYPDDQFDESFDDHLQKGGKFLVTHLYDRTGRTFVPNVPVIVKSIVAQRIYAGFTELLNPYLYCITTQHGPFEWTIYKRYRHFNDLHKSLSQFVEAETKRSHHELQRSKTEVQFLTLHTTSLIRNETVRFVSQKPIQDEPDENPCFPTRSDRMAFINDNIVQERCQILAKYLNKILKHPKFRSHPATREFFNVSCLSFVYGLSPSRKEGYLLKRSHDHYRGQKIFFRLPFFCDNCKFHHGRKWLVVKDTYMTYFRPDTFEVRFPMLVDRGFDVSTGFRHAGTYHGIKIKNLQRTLVLKCRNKRDCDEWTQHFHDFMDEAKDFVNPAVANRFNSYAPVRQDQLAHWFINGKSYMEAVAKALLTAKEEVFITDWWLSPEIMLIRPTDDENLRLDNLLGKIADSGVRVYVMVFKEMSFAIGLNSLHTKRALIGKSQKGFIKVIRHPDHYPSGGVFLWSHHEKMVVIDQKIAFVGGIDLCFGRWDDEFMRLVDLGEENDRNLKMPSEIEEEKAAAGGTETVESAVKATTLMAEQAGEKPVKSSDQMRSAMGAPNKSNEDVKGAEPNQMNSGGMGTQVKFAAKKWISMKKTGTDAGGLDSDDDKGDVEDSTRRVLEADEEAVRRPERYARRWRKLAQKTRRGDSEDSEDEEKPEEPRGFVGPSPVVDTKHRYFIGKDYSNPYEKDFEFLDRYSEDYIDRTKVARMPWHDEALVVFGKAARDVARHFIQRWNIHKCEKFINNDSYPFLLPKTYGDSDDLTVRNWKKFLEGNPFRVDAQCVRSVGPWSAGTSTIESSIQNAYLQMIDAAQHYIYIENQFFITIHQDPQIHNQLGDALFRRIERAHNSREKFRVYIVLPLLPGFDNVNAVQAVLYFIMKSISKGDQSLFKRLDRAGIPADDYLSFYGMRNHDILMGKLITEIIYIHSKLMIIDDRMAICGSANINDRSLLGQRDSEFCLVIKDIEEETARFNGKEVKVGKFCSSWRKRLFEIMLGIHLENPTKIDVTDPVSDEFYNYFRATAKKNAKIYEEVFLTLPSDRVRKFDQLNDYTITPKLKDTDPILSQEKLKEIQGFIVEYPLYFLDEENYLPNYRTREGMVPNILWT